MEEINLTQFEKQSYLNLETVRKNGQVVATPVWFVRDGKRLLVNTQSGSGKVKRVRNFSSVRVMPCDARGKARGDWITAQATIGSEGDARTADRLLTRKYGLQKTLFQLIGWLTRTKYTIIVID